MADFRLIFDSIPEQFDKYRVHYGTELFKCFIEQADINEKSSVLELGPGTGQATEPILDTGCRYQAIELGDNFAEILQRKYGKCSNFSLIHDDFITHDFGDQRYDVIYSAATIQWIPEEIAFRKTFSLLKPGGMLGMILLRGGYRDNNEALYQRIQSVYADYFHPVESYDQRFIYENAVNYGYVDFQRYEFHGERVLTADEYVNFSGTHCDHINIPEPFRTKFFDGLRQAVLDFGNRIVFHDIYTLLTVRKPEQ